MSGGASDMIMLIDDNMLSRSSCRYLINQAGFDVDELPSAAGAAERCSAVRPVAVLVRLSNPADTAELLKKIAGIKDLIVSTCLICGDESDLAGLPEGTVFDDYLVEPFSARRLGATLKSLAEVRRSRYGAINFTGLMEENKELERDSKFLRSVFAKALGHASVGKQSIRYRSSPRGLLNGDLVLFDAVPDTGRSFVVLCDFMGHGIPAALGAIPFADAFYEVARTGLDFVDAVKKLNAVVKASLPVSMFCAMGLVEVDTDTKTVRMFNAGLPDFMLIDRRGDVRVRVRSSSFPLGIVASDSLTVDATVTSAEPGEVIVLYSDGLTEMKSPERAEFGPARLDAIFARRLKPERYLTQIISEAEAFSGGFRAQDDFTVVEVGIRPPDHKDLAPMTAPELENTIRRWSVSFKLTAPELKRSGIVPGIIEQISAIHSVSTRTMLLTVLDELLTNALEHGVLKLDSAMKKGPMGFLRFAEERQRRLLDLSEGEIDVTLDYEGDGGGTGHVTVTVQDSGDGWDHAAVDTTLSGEALSNRGVALIKSVSDRFEYFDGGRSVRARISLTS